MQKIRPIFYLFTTLIIFSIIWFVLFQSKPVIILPTNLLNLFSKRNENTMEIMQQNLINTSTIKVPITTKDSFGSDQLSPEDYTQLVNLNNFEFLHLVECTKKNQYLSLLIAVHTAPSNVEKRQVIRETWGMQRPQTKLIFLMGIPQKKVEMNIIAAEHEKYKDIVQGNFMDTYKNLTYKHVMLLKYVVYHCPKINYLLKTDDDVFVNMLTVLSYIQNYNIAKPRELLYCLPMIQSPAIREKNKWQVTYEEFSGEFYPPYCSGFAELFTSDTVLRLYHGAQISRFLWVDDAFVTGIAREAAKIKITPLPSSLYLNYNEMETIIKINNTYPDMVYPFLLGPVNIGIKDIRDLWYIINHRKNYLDLQFVKK